MAKLRGYDVDGTLLFEATASDAQRYSVRAANDQRTIKKTLSKLGARLVRVEVDNPNGSIGNLQVHQDGGLTPMLRGEDGALRPIRF